ncbi:type I glutamate--ammonia ligase [Kytococcus sp. Marseille-QA3725]
MNENPSTDALTPLTFVATSDLTAITKGRALPTDQLRPGETTGWVPANIGIGTGGHIAEKIPFGSTGDLRLRPDSTASYPITGVSGKPDTTVVFADVITTGGDPWDCCPRTFLRDTVKALQAELGVTVKASFEHEFMDRDANDTHHPFSWRSHRAAEPLGSRVVTSMQAAGLEPENWLPEYGLHQYEVTMRPTDPVSAADRAIVVRDLVRDVFASAGHRASFTPMLIPGESGNGVHVHFSLSDADGRNVFFDDSRPGRLSETGGQFAAGILQRARSLAALFAPLSASYLRLRPNQWASAGIFVGLHNREALLRLCPTVEIGGRDPEPQLHLEFRGGDAGANPWLLLGIVLRAGLEGVRQGVEPALVREGEVDLSDSSAGIPDFPHSLEEALELFAGDEEVRGWFAPDLVETFLTIKREELAEVASLSDSETCEWYARVY